MTVSFLNVYSNYVHGQLFRILSTTDPNPPTNSSTKIENKLKLSMTLFQHLIIFLHLFPNDGIK